MLNQLKLKNNRTRHFWVHSSSEIEILIDAFVKLLFSDQDLFAERIVVVPSPLMQNYLSFTLAERFPALLNVQFFSSKQAIQELIRKLKIKRRRFVPDGAEMRAALLSELGEGELEKAKSLSELFLRYGLKKIHFSSDDGWQEALYHRLFKKNPRWITPYEEIQEVMETASKGFERFTSLFLFGLNYLNPLDEAFYEWISEESPVHEFFLTPTPHYLFDQLSDHQLRRQESLFEEYLIDRQPLLANLGCLVKERQKSFAERSVVELPAFRELEPTSLLEAIRRDFQNLTKPLSREKIENRRSIELHHAKTKLREVEILYDLLLKALDEGLKPEEILVLAPDSMLYAKMIRSYFYDFPVNIAYFDLTYHQESSAVNAFSLLLTLLEGRFDQRALEAFIDHPLSKIHDSISSIKKWFDHFPVEFGKDAEHRSEWLKKEGLESKKCDEGTLKWAIEKLIQQATTCVEGVSLSSTELPHLGALIQLFQEIERAEISLKKERSPREWQLFLKELWNGFFISSDEEEMLFYFFDKLGSLERSLENQPLSFAFIRSEFQLFAEGRALQSKQKELSAIRFSSFLPMRGVPARLIVAIGVSSIDFPKIEIASPLDLSDKEAFLPKRQDFDRALFLEMLLSAKEHLWFLYSQEEEALPSSLIEELFAYIGEHYEVDGLLEYIHPTFGFEKANFYAPFDSYKEAYHRLAFLQEGEAVTPRVYQKKPSHLTLSPYIFSLAAKDPMQLFLKESIGIEWEEEKEPSSQLLIPVKHEKALLMEMLAKGGKKPITDRKEKATFPLGIFGKREEERLYLRYQEIKNKISSEELFQVEFHPDVRGVKEIGEKSFAVESPKLVLEGREIVIQGVMRDLSTQGLILNGEKKRELFIGEWGKLLLWNWVAKKMDISPRVILLKEEEGGSEEAAIYPLEEAFLRYCRFFLFAREELIRFDPKRIALLMESVEKATKEGPAYRSWNLYHQLLSTNKESESDLHRIKAFIQEGFLWEHPLLLATS